MADLQYRKRLRRLRGRADRRGIGVLISRRSLSPNHVGGIMFTDRAANAVIGGAAFNLTLDEAEQRVAELAAELEKRSLRSGRGR